MSCSARLPNSGLFVSSAISSLMKLSTRAESLLFCPSSSGTSPAAFSGVTTATGAGGVRTSSESFAIDAP